MCDGVDNDCSGGLPEGEFDDDYDGWMPCDGDCDDRDFRVHSDMRELCEDGVDNDCDGDIDELCFDDAGDELPEDAYGCAIRLGGGQAALLPWIGLLPLLGLRRWRRAASPHVTPAKLATGSNRVGRNAGGEGG
jgi:hypothetical protein